MFVLRYVLCFGGLLFVGCWLLCVVRCVSLGAASRFVFRVSCLVCIISCLVFGVCLLCVFVVCVACCVCCLVFAICCCFLVVVSGLLL